MTSLSKSDRFFERLYLFIGRRRPFLFLAVLLALVTSAVLISSVKLDMSFNPFFSNDESAVALSTELEDAYGQRLGALFGVIVENDDILSNEFLHQLESVSTELELNEQITEVISLVRFAIPIWSKDGVRSEWLLDSKRFEGVFPQSLLEAVGNNFDLRRLILSEDARKTLILVRPSVARSDLAGRADIIDEFETVVESTFAESSTLHFIGYSVVEKAFARIVLSSLAETFLVTFLALMVILWIVYRRVALVFAALAGVILATPVSVGAMVLMGQDVTMINSLVPVVILIIGVADAVHMIHCYLVRRKRTTKDGAIRQMFVEMGLPCLLTTVTTAGGFLGLCIAKITAIHDFGLNVCIGVLFVYVFNLIVLPSVLSFSSEARLDASTKLTNWIEKRALGTAGIVIRNGRFVTIAFFILIFVAGASIPSMEVNQHVNGEVAPETEMRADQLLLEQDFGGFLGPDVAIRRRDGLAMTSPADADALQRFVEEVAKIQDVDRVESITDLLPVGAPDRTVSTGLEHLRDDDKLGHRVRTMINADLDQSVVSIYVSDVGTGRTLDLVRDVEHVARVQLGQDYESNVYGQWWLAQNGMQNMSRDMLFSFATSLLLILPLMAFALRNVRLFLVSLLPNLLPMVFALAIAVWLDIPIRIGTAMVLAIALGIAVDDTIHMMMRLKRELHARDNAILAVRAAMRHSGAALFITTTILVAGFLSMLTNDLLAIQDMGVMAAGTLTVAFLADIFLAPALFLLLWRKRSVRERRYVPVVPSRPRLSAQAKPNSFFPGYPNTNRHPNTHIRGVEQ